MKKSSRQGIIRKLIQEHEIETQEELISLLKIEGIVATQATVSRDIRELGIVKGHSPEGQVKYVMNELSQPLTEERLQEVVAESVQEITLVEFVLVLQTRLGSANVVAAIIDELKLPEIAGTVAGADTLVIIAKGKEEAKALAEKVTHYMEA